MRRFQMKKIYFVLGNNFICTNSSNFYMVFQKKGCTYVLMISQPQLEYFYLTFSNSPAHAYNINTSYKLLYYDFLSIGVWIDSNHEVMYALASKITFICQMDFNAFPVDIQVRSCVPLHLTNDLESWEPKGIHMKYNEYLTISNK